MKNFDSRTYSINDFLEWEKNGWLQLSPKFQRNSVWSDNARSYLMDTIVRGKPIPKVFMRQKLDPLTHISIREVVDGQQRLRTILSYVKDGFQITNRHNPVAGGLYFSQLDVETQVGVLNYEIAVDLLVNMPDQEVLDVFGRLNSYAVILNEQEKIHANHFGPFKSLADDLGHAHAAHWVKGKILTDAQVLRMADVALAADLLIAMIEGIKSKKQVRPYYEAYEKQFTADVELLATRFHDVASEIQKILEGEIAATAFRRIHVYYSLFTAVYGLKYGLADGGVDALSTQAWNYSRMHQGLSPIEEVFVAQDRNLLNTHQQQFLEDSRRATTDAKIRLRRTKYIASLLKAAV